MKSGVPFGSASLYLASGVAFLNEEDSVYAAMIEGWRAAQIGGRLSKKASAESNLARVHSFQKFTNEWPWNWSAGSLDEWMMHLVSVRRLAPSTIRAYQTSIRAFCDYICSEHYDWVSQCEQRFGTHPVQVCHEWNTVRHLVDYEGRPGRRPLTRKEIQNLLDHVDAEVGTRLDEQKKGALQVYRDATIFKVIYGWGLRADEVAKLEVTDFYRNPEAPEFGSFGMLQVRNGKGSKGSGKKRRSVVTLRLEAVTALRDYIDNVLPLVRVANSNTLWYSERGTQMTARHVADRFGDYRDELGLESALTPHCLRHSYATHLTEEGYDHRFIQEQMGHTWGSTTGIYTHVSANFANTMVRDALSRQRQAREIR
ncbi:tyrosine-type recombinase/integrase [Cryobacterium sp. M15]|uniref:tyrosine-type recombinase/integrase n=1 Tax=Cryobacterium sp. M15 TaxID=2048291 RepID=UPI00271213A4|nr:tyrosine-type recombinase/integrase [Cryobacterium sp. M15]